MDAQYVSPCRHRYDVLSFVLRQTCANVAVAALRLQHPEGIHSAPCSPATWRRPEEEDLHIQDLHKHCPADSGRLQLLRRPFLRSPSPAGGPQVPRAGGLQEGVARSECEQAQCRAHRGWKGLMSRCNVVGRSDVDRVNCAVRMMLWSLGPARWVPHNCVLRFGRLSVGLW